jgi:hypothetical protein
MLSFLSLYISINKYKIKYIFSPVNQSNIDKSICLPIIRKEKERDVTHLMTVLVRFIGNPTETRVSIKIYQFILS